MARKYICDNCGKEVDDFRDLVEFKVSRWMKLPADHLLESIGEYCKDCAKKIEEHIKAGVN